MNQNARQLILFLCGLLVGISNSFSTHLVGGMLTYKHLANDDYEINLVVYRDCYNGVPWFPAPATITFFDSSGAIAANLILPILMIDTLPTPPIYQNACRYKLPDICYHKAIYSGVITLPKKPGGYSAAMTTCCWHQTIDNIFYSTNMTLEMEFTDSTLYGENDAPVFKDIPPTIICQGLPFGFDHSATDSDGDSLVYELFQPIDGTTPPYSVIPYQPGYSLTKITNSVNDMKIDSSTGWLSVTIDSLGQYVYGVRVKEYRNGQYIGSTWRTYEINSASCDTLSVRAEYSPEKVPCSKSNEVIFKIDSTNASIFNWTINGKDKFTGKSIIYKAPDTGTYNVTVIASIGGYNCKDTFSLDFHLDTILDSDSVIADFEIADLYCRKDVAFNNRSFGGDTYMWDFGDLSSDTSESPLHTYTDTGLFNVNLIATSGRYKCRDTLNKWVNILEKPDLVPSYERINCSNVITFNANVDTNFVQFYGLSWEFGDGAVDSVIMPVHGFEPPGNYKIRLIAEHHGNHVGCSDTTYLEYRADLIEYPAFTISASEQQVFAHSDSVQLLADPGNYYRYQWLPAETMNNPSIPDPKVKPGKTTTYIVSVINSLGCITRDTITIYVTPDYCGEAEIFVPNSFTPNNDGENDFLRVRGNSIKELYFTIYNRWGEVVFESTDPGMTEDITRGWDGTYKGKDLSPDVFVYYLKIICYDGGEFLKKGNLTLIR